MIESNRSNGSKLEKINQAIVLHAIRDSSYLLPCPASGAAGNGVSIGACNDTTNNIGTVPWSTLGLSEDDATDAYGNQIVYATSAGPVEACVTSGGNATGAVTTGTLSAGNTTGTASNVLYALVSHGPNGRGSFDAAGNTSTAPTSTEESENCAVGAGCTIPNANFIDTGPFEDDGGGASHFDDEVLLSSSSDFTTECTNFASSTSDPVTVFVRDGFDDSSGDGDSSDITVTQGGGSSASSEGSGVLTVTEEVEIETSGTRFTPDVTPIYASIRWTPTAATTSTGFSIITRADSSTRAGGTSNYTDGITCEFFGDGLPANPQTIEINDSAGTLLGSGGDTYALTLGQTYELECFDDGNNVWARATQVGTTSNQAVVFTTNTSDLGTPNQVIFLHDDTTGAASTLDDLFIARGTIALELDTSGQLANSTAPLTSMTANETSFTEEGWLYLRDTAASTVSLFSVTESPVSEFSLFRTDIANSELEIVDSTPSSLVAGSQTYSTGRWGHYAYNCASTTDRSLYVNGSSTGTPDTVACDILPNTDATTATETVSMINNTGGRVVLSEMRLWSTAQGSSAIGSNYNARPIENPSLPANLHLQLRLEDGFASSTATDSETTNGTENYTVTSGRFVGFWSPFQSAAEDVCPSNRHPTDPFACVYDGTTGTETSVNFEVPLDVSEVRIKVWGGGGGGGVGGNGRAGGGAGYAQGRLASVGGTNIPGRRLVVSAAGAGQIGGANSSGGGGGGSAVEFFDGATTTLVAVAGAGGGGAGRANSGVAGLGGGGTTTEATAAGTCHVATVAAGAPTPVGGTPGAAANCNGTAGAGVTAGGANGGNGDTATGGAGGTGYGNGGIGGAGGTNQGGGGGYTSGAGGGSQGNNAGGGGGASGYVLPTDLTSPVITATSGATAANSGDTDRGTAGTGGAIGAAGSPGRVVICWSSSCLP